MARSAGSCYAWNRLVKVYKDDGDTPGTLVTTGENPDTPLAEYRYDPPSPKGFGGAGGLSRRVRKIDKTGESDVTYDCYYNVAWQLLEVRRGGVASGIKASAGQARRVPGIRGATPSDVTEADGEALRRWRRDLCYPRA